MSLSWNAVSAPDLAGYRVFRGTSLPVATTGNGLGGAALITGTSYIDLTAVNGTAYQYVVVSVDTTGNRSAASTAASVTPSVAAGAAVDLDGTNDYVTFGAAPALNATSFTLETWFRRDGAGVGVTTGTGGITSAIPLVTKAAPRARVRRTTSTATTSWASMPRVASWWPTTRSPPGPTTRSAARPS